MASHSQGHRPTVLSTGLPGTGPTAHGSSRRSGRARGVLLAGDQDSCRSSLGCQKRRPIPGFSAAGHRALPYQAGLLDGTHTSYHGNAALRQTGPLARTTIPGMWGEGARDICPQYPVVTTGKPRL